MTSCIIQEDYEKFMRGKPEYTRKKLLEKMPKEYHSVFDVFIKHEADVLPEHWDENYSIQLEKGKNPSFILNYRPLSG